MDKRGKNRFLASPYHLSVRCGITGRGPPESYFTVNQGPLLSKGLRCLNGASSLSRKIERSDTFERGRQPTAGRTQNHGYNGAPASGSLLWHRHCVWKVFVVFKARDTCLQSQPRLSSKDRLPSWKRKTRRFAFICKSKRLDSELMWENSFTTRTSRV